MVPDKKGAAPAKKAAASTKAAGSPRGPKPGAKAAKAAKASTSGKAASGATDGGDDSDKPDTPASTGGSQRAFKGSTQQWTLQEDNLLRKLVDEHGHRKWSFIAGKMEGRRGKQCRDRWLNHLKPDIRRGEWTAEEERILVEGHRMLGTRWAALAKLLPGRPENRHQEPLARNAAVQVGTARRTHLGAPGVPAQPQPDQRRRCLRHGGAESGGGGSDAVALPHRGGVRRRRRGGGGCGCHQEQGNAGERLRV